jgi:hypothetical protein
MDPLRIIQQTSERQLGLVLVEQVRAAGLTRSARATASPATGSND